MDFRVDSDRRAAGSVLAVHGDFDIATAPVFATAVDEELSGNPRRVIVDLTPTTFADSTACRALMQAAEATTATGATLHVVCPAGNRPVRRILDLIGMHALVPMTESVNEAGSGPAR